MSGPQFILPQKDSVAWTHPAMRTPDPWISGDVGRWLVEEPPPVKWIVEGLIPAGVPGVFAARANAGKSMTALLIGLGLATGREVLGRTVSPDAARGVVFVGLEDDEPEFQRRFRRALELLQEDGNWTAADDKTVQENFKPLFPNRTVAAQFTLDAQWLAISEKAKAIHGGCGLIILDTLARLSEGDENSANETRPFLDAQAALTQSTGASVIAVHHVGKGNDTPSDKKLWQRLHPEALRGSSAIEAGARFILTMATLSPQEAALACLDEADAAQGGLVALMLAKATQVEKGLTLLLKRRRAGQHGAGFLVPHPDSETAITAVLGGVVVPKLQMRDKVLLAIAEAGNLKVTDQKAVAANLWPQSKNPKSQWDKHLSGLRQSGFLLELHLSDLGWKKAESIGFHRKRSGFLKSVNPQDPTASSAGSLKVEEAEASDSSVSSFPSISLKEWKGRKGEEVDPDGTGGVGYCTGTVGNPYEATH